MLIWPCGPGRSWAASLVGARLVPGPPQRARADRGSLAAPAGELTVIRKSTRDERHLAPRIRRWAWASRPYGRVGGPSDALESLIVRARTGGTLGSRAATTAERHCEHHAACPHRLSATGRAERLETAGQACRGCRLRRNGWLPRREASVVSEGSLRRSRRSTAPSSCGSANAFASTFRALWTSLGRRVPVARPCPRWCYDDMRCCRSSSMR